MRPEPPPLTSAGADSAGHAPAPTFSRRGWLLLLLLLAATALVKGAFALSYRGYLTGDDLEIVQIAAKYAAGVDYQPWVLRCLFHPIVLGWIPVKLGVLLFGARPEAVDMFAALPTLAFSTASIVLVAILARRWGWPEASALAAAFLYAFAWLPLAFGGTPYPRPISTALMLASFLLVTARRRPLAASALAGALAGAAFAVRWSEGVVLLPLLGWTWWQFRDSRRVAAIAAGFTAGVCLCAALVDWLTWGRPFASLIAFVRIMWLEIPASRLAREERLPWYFLSALRWAGPILLLLLIPAWKVRRARPALAIFASIVVLMSGFAHKEWRYLQVAIPFLALAAAAGWERLRDTRRRWLATAALVLCVPYGLERSATIFRDKVGGGIDAARFIRDLRPPPRVVAFEQMWAYGEHLWLGNDVVLREIELDRPLRPGAIRAAAAGADLAGVYALHLDRAALRELAALGFRPIVSFRRNASYECSLFGRGAFAPRRPTVTAEVAGKAVPPGPTLRAATPPPGSGRP